MILKLISEKENVNNVVLNTINLRVIRLAISSFILFLERMLNLMPIRHDVFESSTIVHNHNIPSGNGERRE